MEKGIQDLNRIIDTTIHSMETSKEQIYEIWEYTKTEEQNVRRDLQLIMEEVRNIVDKHDEYEREYRRKCSVLAHVSRNFQKYTEEDIRRAYDDAYKMQMELRVTREREQYLIKRRDELTLRLKNLEKTIEKADNLISQFGVVLNYLKGDISRIGDELKEAKDVQAFGLRIIEAQEEERRRVSREIHDGPAQSMANVVLRAELAERMMNQGSIDDAKVELRNLKNTVRDSLADVRRIIYDLRPMALDDLGLVPALRRYVEAYKETKPFTINFKLTGTEIRLPTPFEVAIYRLVQESMNNIVKHAQATKVDILIHYGKEKIELMIQDDGVGFVMMEEKKEQAFGLVGMRERVRLLSGELQIESALNKGTTISIRIPYPQQQQ